MTHCHSWWGLVCVFFITVFARMSGENDILLGCCMCVCSVLACLQPAGRLKRPLGLCLRVSSCFVSCPALPQTLRADLLNQMLKTPDLTPSSQSLQKLTGHKRDRRERGREGRQRMRGEPDKMRACFIDNCFKRTLC